MLISAIKTAMTTIAINSAVTLTFEKVNVREIDDDLRCDWPAWFELTFILASNMR
ncbi:MAG: hypothetical protein Altm2KO_23490 [Alteromonas macleodii]